jgi:hypothetical protein
MVDQPNRSQSGALFRWEFIQQMHLHGACLIWNRPSMDGSRTAARYIIPLAITQPVRPGEYESCPNGGVRIQYFNTGLGFVTDPLLRILSGAILPIENLSVVRYPHPSMRGDGKSPTDAGGWWIDSALMVDMVRWKHLKRGPRPLGFVTFDDADISDQQLEAAEKRINRKMADEDNDQRAVALGGGAKLDRDTPPVDMEYTEAFDQIGQAILALHGVGKSMVGLSENMTYGSNAAAMQMAQAVVQGDLDLLAGEWTRLAQDEGAQVTVEFETQPLDDPTLIEQQLTNDITAGTRTVREWRAIRGLPPFGDWRDDARVTSQGFVLDEKQPPQKQGQPPQQAAMGESATAPSPFARSLSLAKAIPLPDAKPGPVVAVDLDGTLAEYDGGFDPDYIGTPIASAVDKVAKLKRAGCRIVIFTCREDNETLRGWLAQAGVPYDAINENPDVSRSEMGSGKVMADVYWDDRAVNASEGLDAIAALLPEGYSHDKLSRPRGSDGVGVVMLELPPDVVQSVRDEQARIDPMDMTGDGLEEWPHVTLLYGIVGVPLGEVVDQVRRLDAIDVTFGPTSVFANDSDILKIEVHGSSIHAANAKLAGVLPVESTYPDYQPHVTLAELNPGAAYNPRSGLVGRATTLTHAIVVVGEQRVRVPLRISGQAVAIAPEAADRMVSVAKAQNIFDRYRDKFADYEAERKSEKQNDEVAQLADTVKSLQAIVAEQLGAMAKAMTDIGSFARFNANQPRDAQGRWVSTGDVSGAIGNLTKMKELFGRLKPEDTGAAEQLVAFLQENGASEEDAKQAMKEATGKESTGANKPDPAKVAAAGGSTKPAVEPKKEAGSKSTGLVNKDGKEPWQLTKDEHVAERVRRIDEFKRLSDEHGGVPESFKNPEVVAAWKAQEEWSDVDMGHQPKVAAALAQGKPVPPEVLAQYPRLKEKYPDAGKPSTASSNSVTAVGTEGHKQAAASVREKGQQSGLEHAVLVDKDGNQVGDVRTGTEGTVDVGAEALTPGAGLTSVHNHPDNSTLSPEDLKSFSTHPGLDTITAVGHDGQEHHVTVTGDREQLRKAVDAEEMKIKEKVSEKIFELEDASPDGKLSAEQKAEVRALKHELRGGIALEMEKQGLVKLDGSYKAGGESHTSSSPVEYLASPPSFRGPAAAEAREKVIASLGPLGEGVDTYTVSTIAGASESAGLKPGMSASDPKAIEVAGMLDMKPEALVAVVNAVHDPQFAPVEITPLEFRGREHSLAVAQKLDVPPNTVGQAVRFSEQAQVTADIAPEDPRLFKYANSVNGHPAHIVKAIAHEIGPAPAAPNIAPPETVHRIYKEGETRRVVDSLTPELEKAGNAVELTPALKAYTAEANTMSLDINRAARDGKLDSLPATERQVFEQLNSQIKEKKTKFSEPINLYRGIAIPDEQAGAFMQNITAAAEAGSPIEMKGLISSSLSPGIASRFATMSDPALGKTTPMVFEMKSHSGMYVGKRSIAPQEMEMMHEHGSRYRVLGVEKQVNVGGLVTTLIKLEQL